MVFSINFKNGNFALSKRYESTEVTIISKSPDKQSEGIQDFVSSDQTLTTVLRANICLRAYSRTTKFGPSL